ncbi:MerR family transcriptional regulator [Nonomuraea sp. NPDC059194]|uniref:MerR family transcriptional regulator n=1 Tax=Nonomuraea sp. NPDC059194 TaxID=3346764 RepID=UPI0036D0A40E
MRIGELASLVGVSTRTVRHYHHLGLLPEPGRLANGYREYRLKDAVLLSRVRQLAGLGMSLDELRDVLADDRGKDLREVLQELDADLARQQEAIKVRRATLAALLAEADLHPDSVVAPDMAAVLRDLSLDGSTFARLDRELLTLMSNVANPHDRERVLDLIRPLTEPAALAEGHELYRRLDELAEADLDDERIADLAHDLAAHLPVELVKPMIENAGPEGTAWLDTLNDEMAPAQAEVFRLLMVIVKGCQ